MHEKEETPGYNEVSRQERYETKIHGFEASTMHFLLNSKCFYDYINGWVINIK